MKKRIHVLLLALISASVLVGWGGKEVKLLNSEKLIKLDEAIERAKPGGMAGDTEEALGPDEDTGDEKEPDSKSGAADPDTEARVRNIDIRIRGERIFYTCGDVNSGNISDTQLEERIRTDHAQGAQVTLIDDYAEAHVYRKALGILEELKNETGLSFKEERFTGGE